MQRQSTYPGTVTQGGLPDTLTEALAIEVGQRLRGQHVVEVLNRLVRQRGAPKYLFADNGGEFTCRLVDLWACHHGVRIDFVDIDGFAIGFADMMTSCNLRCQRRSIVGTIPKSRATSACDRPLVSHSATDSRLSSSVN